MKLAIIGYGQAGGKILDAFLRYQERTEANFVRSALAINTARADLQGLSLIPEDRRVLIGQERVKGHGTGADNELGATIAKENLDELQNALDDVPVHEIDAFLVIAGLGGGTGSGGAPVLVRHLQRLYTEPIYGLGIVPAVDEGGLYSLNAARSLKTMLDHVDSLLLFDNDAWRQSDESIESGFEAMNRELAKRLGVLFRAGEDISDEYVAESIVDSSEIINTLAGGGISSVGYATDRVVSEDSKGLLARFKEDESDLETAGDNANRITSLVRKAALGQLTIPCEISGARRALVLVAGPPKFLSRRGIERGRRWIEEETGSREVRGGDYPVPDTDHVACVVLFGGLSTVPRVEQLAAVAKEVHSETEEAMGLEVDRLEEIMGDAEEDLEPLF